MKQLSFVCMLFATGITAPAWGDIVTLASFDGTHGATPSSNLVLSGSTLYGTTANGGADSLGAIFSLPVTGGTPTVLTSLDSTGLQSPSSNLILSGSTLYTTTSFGGSNGVGAVISMPLNGTTPTILASLPFNYAFPGGLLLSGSTLYMNSFGNAGSGGGVLSLPITGGSPTLLTAFTNSNGYEPDGSLVISGGTLYGTTQKGGVNNEGVVFSASTTIAGPPTVLTSFSGTNGQTPTSGLILSGNTLYGMTSAGGVDGDGEVFSISTSGGTPTILASFNGINGATPEFSNLILSGDTLYGTTFAGGADNDGVIFSLPITGGTPTVLASFDGTNGDMPEADLLLDNNILYGVTLSGGANGDGTVFSLAVPEPGTLSLLALASFGLLARRRVWRVGRS